MFLHNRNSISPSSEKITTKHPIKVDSNASPTKGKVKVEDIHSDFSTEIKNVRR